MDLKVCVGLIMGLVQGRAGKNKLLFVRIYTPNRLAILFS